MLRRAATSLVILSMLVTFLTSGYSFGADAYPRNGFHLSVLESDSTGIAVDTEFILETQQNFTLSEVRQSFSIDGEPAPLIEEMDKNLFSINLSRPLLENSIYTFRMKTDIETTWVFQTRTSFKIISSLPSDKSVNVPLNSGIEINFSHENFSNIEDFFEITPHVEGRFEVHKKTAVFVPDRLKEATLYTIKINKGIKINNTDRTIEDDYVFSFETETLTPSSNEPYISMNYQSYIYDFTSSEKPEATLNYYTYNRSNNSYTTPMISLHSEVYAFRDFDSFFEAIENKSSVPSWANLSHSKNLVSVEKLDKVLEFDQIINENKQYSGSAIITVPQNLPVGYYVLESTWQDFRLQTFLQITNNGIYITKSTTKTIVWLNDLESQAPIKGANIRFTDSEGSFYSDSEGVAVFDTPVKAKSDTAYWYYSREYLIITPPDGKPSILDCVSYNQRTLDCYWDYFFTDRNMYKPDDTVNIWGFIKNRYDDEKINYLTLEINQGYSSSGIPILKQNIDVKNGFFESAVNLPNLTQGYYYLTLKKDDTVVVNSYIRVSDYIKPSYKMDITKGKEAFFLGEDVDFKVNTAFFEGTGVPNLKVNYTITNSSPNKSLISSESSTDALGNLNLKYTPSFSETAQGEQYVSISARALLPESGQIQANNRARVFVNDISVKALGEIINGKGTINAKANKIVLDRLNDGTAKSSTDYLGAPVNGKEFKGTVYKNTWRRHENGTYYDYISKLTYKRYRYELVSTPVQYFSMISSADGNASYVFDAPKIEDTYYSAEITCVDDNGRNMLFKVYLGEKLEYSTYESSSYRLESEKYEYGLGETVELDLKYGKDPLPKGKYLYIRAQNGIFEHTTSDYSHYSYRFDERDIPQAEVRAVYFSGKGYASAGRNIIYKSSERQLFIEAKADMDTYKPGDTASILLSVKDISGRPVKASVNVSIVDEAFFKLSQQNVDTLAYLYNYVNSGLYFEGRSHYNKYYIGMDDRKDEPIPATWGENSPPSIGGGGGSSEEIREDFKDTAQFLTVETDSSGTAEVSFKLPDNITSWRVTLSALSTNLYAGNSIINMNASLPFFINYSFNTTYLEGDKPVIGVNAYGNGLKEGDSVMFEISDYSKPDRKVTVEGKAFERINIPFWALEEGNHDLVIRAYTSKGLSDAVKHSISVVKSYYQIERAEYYDLASGINIAGGSFGNTNLVFHDRSKGMFLSQLINLYYSSGNRIDQVVSKYIAYQLILEHFKDDVNITEIVEPSLAQYQKEGGGLSLLPYSSSDLDISTKLSLFAKDLANNQNLKNYFSSFLDHSNNNEKIKALYGLSAMKEPVLLELNKISLLDNLSVMELIYLALSYCELGDLSKAEQIYDERISDYIEKFDPYFRVNTGYDKDDILEATSLCSVLAARLEKAEKTGLYEYCSRNYSTDILLSTERLMFISNEIGKAEKTASSFTYSFKGEEKTVSLGNGRSHYITLLSDQLKDLAIKDVQGDISVVSIFKEDILEINNVDRDISITRSYSLADGSPATSNFKQGDIVKVRLEWNIKPQAFDGIYEITDYLPSGLKPNNSYMNCEGQKVRFYIYNSDYWRSQNYIEYNARVISPGTYTAQGPIIQGKTSRDNINNGKSEIINIDASGDISNPLEITPPPSPTPDDGTVLGDLNKDSSVNSTDYALLKRYILGTVTDLAVPIYKADFNGDGSVNSTDFSLLKRYLLGLIREFPVENM